MKNYEKPENRHLVVLFLVLTIMLILGLVSFSTWVAHAMFC